MKDIPPAAQELLSKHKGKIGMEAIARIMDSDQGKALLKQLSGEGGDALKNAAAAAATGDKGAAGRLVASLLSTKEGQTLAAQIMEMVKN